MKKKVNTGILLPLFLFICTLAKAQIVYVNSWNYPRHDTLKINILKIKTDSVPYVELYFTVKGSDGKDVTDLTQKDFEIREDGKKNQVISFEKINSGNAANVAIVMDHSSSMEFRLASVKEEAEGFVSQFNPDFDAVSIVGLGSSVEQNFSLTKDRIALDKEISEMKSAGTTALFDGIYAGIKDVEISSGIRAVVVLTDGDDNSSDINKHKLVKYLKTDSVPVYIVNVGFEYDSKLDRIAEVSHGMYFQASAKTGLHTVSYIIKNQLQREIYYKLIYRSEESDKEKYHSQISAKGSENKIKSSPVFFEYENKNIQFLLPLVHHKEAEKKCEEVSGDPGR